MPMVEVSNGELIDKFTILVIKRRIIKDELAIKNINNEMACIYPCIVLQLQDEKVHELKERLEKINSELWKIEDDLREHERLQKFDNEFIQLARSVYKLNDARSGIKREINILTKSDIIEEKSYAK